MSEAARSYFVAAAADKWAEFMWDAVYGPILVGLMVYGAYRFIRWVIEHADEIF